MFVAAAGFLSNGEVLYHIKHVNKMCRVRR